MTDAARGYVLGFIGVVIFGLTLPFTRIAVAELDPVFVSVARTVVAGFAALALLIVTRPPQPSRRDFKTLAVIAAGVVIGFPTLSAIAMTTVPASHGGVVLGALPLLTAAMGTVFAGERPSRAFWFWAAAGSGAVIVFAVWDSGVRVVWGDILLVFAAVAAAMGYAAGGSLSRTLGGWQVICWALAYSLPFTLTATLFMLPTLNHAASPAAWAAFLYLALMSQFLGFFFWNRGLALGGVAKVGQVQLLQIFVTLFASSFLLSEPLTLISIVFALIVALCVWLGRRAAVGRA